MSDEVTLTVDGTIYGGWKEFEFQRRVDECCAAFMLDVTERWPGTDARRPIRDGAAYALAIGGEEIAAGFIDEVTIDYDSTNHTVTIMTRCGLADVVDCAAVVDGSHEYRNLTLLEIAARISKPLGATVSAQCDVGAPFPRFAIQPGETAWAAIERGMRLRGLLGFSNGKNELVLTRAGLGGRAGGSVELGRNVKGASGTFSHAGRFSAVIVRGQQEAADELDTASEMHAEGRALDTGVRRYRPTVIIGEAVAPGQTLTDRAEWHKAVALGRSVEAGYTQAGWRDDDGALWRPNMTVAVRDDYLNVDAELLIASVGMTLTKDRGRETVLTVAPPSAYDLLPEAEAKAADAGDGTGTAYGKDVWR